jgi:hypothetical protein
MTAAASNALAGCRGFSVTPRAVEVFGMLKRKVAKALPRCAGRVEIVHDSYEAAPDIEATWFIDPPYAPVNITTKTGNPKGQGYGSGCQASDIDFSRLAEFAGTRRGQVIVCEQAGATWLPFTPLYGHVDSLGKAKTEVVWLNDSESMTLF